MKDEELKELGLNLLQYIYDNEILFSILECIEKDINSIKLINKELKLNESTIRKNISFLKKIEFIDYQINKKRTDEFLLNKYSEFLLNYRKSKKNENKN